VRQIDGYPLWLGNVGDVRNPQALIAMGIGAVIDLTVNEPPASLPHEFVHCRFPLMDGADNPAWLIRAAAETVATLLKADVRTLIYCGAGMSRTPAVAAAGLSIVAGISPTEALARLCATGVADVSPALWADVQAAMA
jgi:hypothetical protein